MRRNIFYKFIMIYCCILAFVDLHISHAATQDNDLINAIQRRYENVKSFEADFEQSLTHKESGAIEKRKGKLYFKKPLSIRWQTNKPHEETLVITNKEIWDYLPEEEVAYRYSPALVQDSRSIIQVLTGQAALTKDFDVKNGGTSDGQTKLILYPHEPTTQMIEAAIWVEPSSGYIKRANVTDFYGNSNDVRFVSFTPEVKIPEERFQFLPPKGIEVEDRLEKSIEEKELFK